MSLENNSTVDINLDSGLFEQSFISLTGVPKNISVFDYNAALDILVTSAGSYRNVAHFPGNEKKMKQSHSVTGISNSIAFYSLLDLGCPRKSFIYDLQHPFSWIKIQAFQSNPNLATDGSDDSILLWDPQNYMSTLVNVVYPRQGQITAFEWNPQNRNLFTLASSSGIVSIWDSRTKFSNPTQVLSISNKQTKKLQWCPNRDGLLAFACDSKFMVVWDIRKGSSVEEEKSQKLNSTPRNYLAWIVKQGISDFSWDSAEESIWTISKDRSIKLASIKQIDTSEMSCNAVLGYHNSSAMNGDNDTAVHIYPAPTGKGVMVENFNTMNQITNISYLEFDRDKAAPVDFVVARGAKPLLGCGWRGLNACEQQNYTKSFFTLSPSGTVHTISWVGKTNRSQQDVGSSILATSSNQHILNHKSPSKYFLSSEKSSFGGSEYQERSLLELRNRITAVSTSGTNKPVVGPVRFLTLMQEELLFMESAMRSKLLDSIRVGLINQFSRVIVLECVLSTGSISSRSFSFEYSTAIRSGESSTIDLIIRFPKKFAQFWQVSFSLDNKCVAKVDMAKMSAFVIPELDDLVKGWSSKQQVSKSNNNRGLATRSSDSSDYLLFNIAKVFKEKSSLFWEATLNEEKMANSSFSQSGDSRFGLWREIEQLGEEDALLSRVEATAFRVPFPTVSGGLFSKSGHLVLFGNARLVTDGATAAQNKCSFVSSLSAKTFFFSSLSNIKRHKSYADLLVELFKKNSEYFVGEEKGSHDAGEDEAKGTNGSSVSKEIAVNQNEGSEDGASGYKVGDVYEEASGDVSKTYSNVDYILDKASRLAVTQSSGSLASTSMTGTAVTPPKIQSAARVGEKSASRVTIVHGLLGAKLSLAGSYSLGPVRIGQATVDEQVTICRNNTLVVETFAERNRQLSQFWSLLAVALEVVTVYDNGGLITWSCSVLGSNLFQRLMQYLITSNDIQTWATAIIVIGGSAKLLKLWEMPSQLESCFGIEKVFNSMANIQRKEYFAMHCENMLYTYSQILLSWGETLHATQVIKFIRTDRILSAARYKFDIPTCETFKLGLYVNCFSCRDTSNSGSSKNSSKSGSKGSNKNQSRSRSVSKTDDLLWYKRCNALSMTCVLCTLPVQGVAVACVLCGHGGHENHLSSWFLRYEECPTGCMCKCRTEIVLNSEENIDSSGLEDDTIFSSSISDTRKPSFYERLSQPHYLDMVSIQNNMLSEFNYNNFQDIY